MNKLVPPVLDVGRLHTSELTEIASDLYFLSLSILSHILSSSLWVKMAFEASTIPTSVSPKKKKKKKKIPERFTSVYVSETSGFEFRIFFFLRKEKRLNMLYSAYTSHERWQAVYMKEECEATWADYHTSHQRALRFQLMWLAAVLHAKSVIEPAHHIPVQYHEVDCHVEKIFSPTLQLEDITWPCQWLLLHSVPYVMRLCVGKGLCLSFTWICTVLSQ